MIFRHPKGSAGSEGLGGVKLGGVTSSAGSGPVCGFRDEPRLMILGHFQTVADRIPRRDPSRDVPRDLQMMVWLAMPGSIDSPQGGLFRPNASVRRAFRLVYLLIPGICRFAPGG
jgi:hypothetical protein